MHKRQNHKPGLADQLDLQTISHFHTCVSIVQYSAGLMYRQRLHPWLYLKHLLLYNVRIQTKNKTASKNCSLITIPGCGRFIRCATRFSSKGKLTIHTFATKQRARFQSTSLLYYISMLKQHVEALLNQYWHVTWEKMESGNWITCLFVRPVFSMEAKTFLFAAIPDI